MTHILSIAITLRSMRWARSRSTAPTPRRQCRENRDRGARYRRARDYLIEIYLTRSLRAHWKATRCYGRFRRRCQKLSLQPRRSNADDSYQARSRFTKTYWRVGYCVMWGKYVNNCAPKSPPRCFSCARPMQLVRRTPRFGGLPDLCTFECRECGVWHIEEGGAAEGRLTDLAAALAA
jgi:hypothetical protein